MFVAARQAHATSEGVDGRERSPIDEAMDRYADGDDRAFAVVYDGLAPRLYGFLLRQTKSAAKAEDILQQTFLKIHKARGSFLRGSSVTPWAYAIARRLVIDGSRRFKLELLARDDDGGAKEPPARDASAEDMVQSMQLARRLEEALAALPENQRIAFQLLKQEDLSVAEAASVLGTTPMAVKLRAHRAYEALREVLGESSAERARRTEVEQ